MSKLVRTAIVLKPGYLVLQHIQDPFPEESALQVKPTYARRMGPAIPNLVSVSARLPEGSRAHRR